MFIGSESRPIILDLYREKTQIRLRIYNTDTGMDVISRWRLVNNEICPK